MGSLCQVAGGDKNGIRKKLRIIRKGRADCSHWWLIDSPDGAISRGCCKYCGAVREFLNYYEPNIKQVIWAERRAKNSKAKDE